MGKTPLKKLHSRRLPRQEGGQGFLGVKLGKVSISGQVEQPEGFCHQPYSGGNEQKVR